MRDSENHLLEYLHEVLPKRSTQVAALFQPPKRAVAGLNNDKVGVCPFCQRDMELSSVRIQGGTNLPVYLCRSDQYTAPLPNESQE